MVTRLNSCNRTDRPGGRRCRERQLSRASLGMFHLRRGENLGPWHLDGAVSEGNEERVSPGGQSINHRDDAASQTSCGAGALTSRILGSGIAQVAPTQRNCRPTQRETQNGVLEAFSGLQCGALEPGHYWVSRVGSCVAPVIECCSRRPSSERHLRRVWRSELEGPDRSPIYAGGLIPSQRDRPRP